MITVRNLKECEAYYNEGKNAYVFDDDVVFRFNLGTDKDIDAWDIDAGDITARDITAGNIDARNIDAVNIDARNITAWNIDARNIDFYAICIAYESFKCESVKGRRKNARALCLDGEIEIKGGEGNVRDV